MQSSFLKTKNKIWFSTEFKSHLIITIYVYNFKVLSKNVEHLGVFNKFASQLTLLLPPR